MSCPFVEAWGEAGSRGWLSEGESHNGLMVLPLGPVVNVPLRILDCGIMFWDLTGRLFGPCVKVLLDGADGSLHTEKGKNTTKSLENIQPLITTKMVQ